MDEQQLKQALAHKTNADKWKRQLETYVLLKASPHHPEVVYLGSPDAWNKDRYSRVEIAVPDPIRRWAFRLWKRETTLKYNEAVRAMAQIGLQTEHELLPLPEAHQ